MRLARTPRWKLAVVGTPLSHEAALALGDPRPEQAAEIRASRACE